jgi:hypothetical protein
MSDTVNLKIRLYRWGCESLGNFPQFMTKELNRFEAGKGFDRQYHC